MENSRRRPVSSNNPPPTENKCPQCGNTFLSKSTLCQVCNTRANRGDEVVKKVTDDNDLIKGGLR